MEATRHGWLRLGELRAETGRRRVRREGMVLSVTVANGRPSYGLGICQIPAEVASGK